MPDWPAGLGERRRGSGLPCFPAAAGPGERPGQRTGHSPASWCAGGDLDPDILRADAARYYSIYGVYGISVFAVRDVTLDELAQQVPLVRFDRLSLLNVRDVLVAGMRLEPTGRNPRHYTVSFDRLKTCRRAAACRLPASRHAERLPRPVTWMVEAINLMESRIDLAADLNDEDDEGLWLVHAERGP